MSARWVLLVALAATACGQQAENATATSPAPPPAVRPVEVTTPTEARTPPAPDELAQLRARVAQLETDLASCRAQGTQAAPIPTGADVPPTTPTEATPTPAQPAQQAAGTTPATRPTAQRRREDGTLIDQILGPPSNERRRDDDQTIRLPNPAEVLLGNGRE